MKRRRWGRRFLAGGIGLVVVLGPVSEEVRLSVDDLLHATGTRAFLVVHQDRLVVERYLDGATAGDRQTSFSMAKSVPRRWSASPSTTG